MWVKRNQGATILNQTLVGSRIRFYLSHHRNLRMELILSFNLMKHHYNEITSTLIFWTAWVYKFSTFHCFLLSYCMISQTLLPFETTIYNPGMKIQHRVSNATGMWCMNNAIPFHQVSGTSIQCVNNMRHSPVPCIGTWY